MRSACYGGYLSVAQWLLEMGAAADIAKVDSYDKRPMYWACEKGHLPISQWLILNSALNNPRSEHVDRAIAMHDIAPAHRPALLAWAQDMIDRHRTFLHDFLHASILLPASQWQAHPSERCQLPNLPREIFVHVARFAGVETGRPLRNIREFQREMNGHVHH